MGYRKMTGGMAAKWHRNFTQLKLDAAARGLTIPDLSEMADLSRGTITKWINIPQRPRTKNWNEVQRVLATMPIMRATKPAENGTQQELELISDPAAITQSFKDDGNENPVTDVEAATAVAEPATVVPSKRKYPKHTKGYTKTAAWYATREARKGVPRGMSIPTPVPAVVPPAKPTGKQVLIGMIVERINTFDIHALALLLAEVMRHDES